MTKVDYFTYTNFQAYASGRGKKESSLSVSHADLLRHSISMGRYTGHPISFFGWLSYYSTIAAALKSRHGHYQISPFYEKEETSFKAGISFRLGMLAAYIVSEQVYGAVPLYHLNDRLLNVYPQGGVHPDFFAPTSKYGSMLVEAKGTALSRVASGKVGHAVNQLNAIRTVSYNSQPPAPPATRRVICSSFSRNGNDTYLEYHDVDPVADGDIELSFDINEATTLYYWPWMQILSSSSSGIHQECTYNGLKYKVCDLMPGAKVGIEEGLFRVLFQKDGKPSKTVRYNDVREKLESIAISPLQNNQLKRAGEARGLAVSQGLDGVLVELSLTSSLSTPFNNQFQFENLGVRL